MWKESLSVDVTSIDDEHRALAQAVEALFGLLRQDAAKATVLANLDAVIEAVAAHFAHEERIMRNINMREYPAHCQLHRALLDEIHQFRADLAEGIDTRTVDATEHFLQFWLYRHITSEDHKIREHLHRT